VENHDAQDDRDTDVERPRELALLIEQQDREHDRVHGFEIQRERCRECAEVSHRDEAERERQQRASHRECK
jgi:hypothetical protein